MNIALCLIVKNEEDRIIACLNDIFQKFSEIIVVDTGSTDNTRNIIRDNFPVRLIDYNFSGRKVIKNEALNYAFTQVKLPWILRIDADEIISADDVQKLLDMPDVPDCHGYFFAWHTHKRSGVIHDYKLFLFRQGLRARGKLHENIQLDIRQHSLQARWCEHIIVHHYPSRAKEAMKKNFYTKSLHELIGNEKIKNKKNGTEITGFLATCISKNRNSIRLLNISQLRPRLSQLFSLWNA